MKIALIIVRTLMGALFFFGGAAYFLDLVPEPVVSGNAKLFMEGVAATVYLMPLIKVTELLCGVLFVIGRYVALATVLIAPVIVNIFFFSIFIDRSILPVSIFLVCANLFVAFAYRKKYQGILTST